MPTNSDTMVLTKISKPIYIYIPWCCVKNEVVLLLGPGPDEIGLFLVSTLQQQPPQALPALFSRANSFANESNPAYDNQLVRYKLTKG